MAAAAHARAGRARHASAGIASAASALLFALVVLLYLAISPLRSLIADLHLEAQRRAQLHALERQHAALVADRALAAASASTSDAEARNLGLCARASTSTSSRAAEQLTHWAAARAPGGRRRRR